MAKRISTRRIKKNRLYTYEEAAEVSGVTTQTIRSFRPKGLTVMSERRPHYILGEALIEFIDARQKQRSIDSAPDRFLCFSCRVPQRPLGMMVDYVPINETRGSLQALCEICEGRMHRFVRNASLKDLDQIFDIARRSKTQA